MRQWWWAALSVVTLSVGAGAAVNASPQNLTAPWAGAYGGLPPFDKVRVTDFASALEAGMAAQLAELEAITSNEAAPTFENTIAAKEHSGAQLKRVNTIFQIWSSNMNTPEFQAVEQKMAPKLAAFDDRITQNPKLFARVEAVYRGPEYKTLNPERQRLTWEMWNGFVRAGARLDAAGKARMSQINQRLATLFTTFSNNLLADEESYVTWLSADQIGGLPPPVVDAAASAAKERGGKAPYAITNTRSSMEPFLTYSNDRALREKVWRTYYSRGDNGDKNDNKAIIREILKLRAERAKLLGYPTHAHWRLEVAMARTPENAMKLMEDVWPAAIARVKEEVTDMQAIADTAAASAGGKITIEPWDYRYYAEKVRTAKYALNADEVREYLQLDKLREGMFWVAGQLFDLEFTPVSGIPVYHSDMNVWKVTRKSNGNLVGLWYFDPYARAGKHSGAWMNNYRDQEKIGDREVLPIVSNNANFVKGEPGAPVLISWDDASTLFHEFGHALHGLCSHVTYGSLSGTNVARDFVEFPSQLLEHWLLTPEVLSRFALNVKTGEPMPAPLVERIKAAARFNEGFITTEYLSAALIDMQLHLAGSADIDPDKFERETLTSLHMPHEIVMRHRTPQFGHVFSGDGYSAGYYSYLWSDTLTADAAEAFEQSPGGYYDKGMATKLREQIFAVGDTMEPAEAFRRFRGRDVDTAALMRKRGFPVPAAKSAMASGAD